MLFYIQQNKFARFIIFILIITRMSFLFRVNGMQIQKSTKILTALNGLQGLCSWFCFIGAILLANIKNKYSSFFGDTTVIIEKTYNPLISLFCIIGVYQALFGILITLILLGKAEKLTENKRLWASIIHIGLLIHLAFTSYLCLYVSSTCTVFAATNDSYIEAFLQLDKQNPMYKYFQSYYMYSNYVVAWAIFEFIICLPIVIINLYLFHAKFINYDNALIEEQGTKKPQIPLEYSNNQNQNQSNITEPSNYHSTRPMEVAMIQQ